MNKQKLVELASKAGFIVDEISMKYQPSCIMHTNYMIDEQLKKFAELLIEKCANICEHYSGAEFNYADSMATEIRNLLK